MATQEQKQEQYGPRIYSDFFHMSEGGVSTPMLALESSRSGRMAATALEQKGLTRYEVKFFLQASFSKLEFECSSTRVTENQP